VKTPRAYQQLAIARMAQQNLLLADACGLGKTLSAIEATKTLNAEKTIIVAPKNTTQQWANAIAEQVPHALVIRLDAAGFYMDAPMLPNGRAAFDVTQLDDYCAPVYLVTHYAACKKWLAPLCTVRWCVKICDEAHRIRARKTAQTQALKALPAKRAFALTATPIDKDPAEIWSILNFLDKRKYSSYWSFSDKHTIRDNWKKFLALRDPDAFRADIAQMMLQRSKADVAPQLPPLIETRIDAPIDGAQLQLYKKIKKEIGSEIAVEVDDAKIKAPIVLTFLLRLRQALSFPQMLGSKASSAKLDALQEWIDDNADASFIIFTDFRETAEHIAQQYNIPCVIGGQKRAFDPQQTQRLVGTIASMSEGLDLPHIDNAIFIDYNWSSILMLQAKDRIHRMNIINAKNVFYIHTPNSVDDYIAATLDAKHELKDMTRADLLDLLDTI
jgi:SNF2 family DNA or RNA helicase